MTQKIIDIRVSNLSLEYKKDEKRIEALESISFEVERGSLTSIVGPSGCGKTSLLQVLMGHLQPSDGFTWIDEQRSEGGMAYVPQDGFLFPWRTLLQNAAIGVELKGNGTLESGGLAGVRALVDKYGLRGFEDSYPSELSGGMLQRVAVIRALASSPAILLCDEPFSAVDFVTRLELNMIFRNMCSISGATTIFVTHNIEEAIYLGDEVIVMSARPGKIVNRHNAKLSKCAEDVVKSRQTPEFNNLFSEIWNDLEGAL